MGRSKAMTENADFEAGVQHERERIRAALQRIRQEAYKPDDTGSYTKHTLGMMSGIAEAIDVLQPEQPETQPVHYTPCCRVMTNWTIQYEDDDEGTNGIEEVWMRCIKCGNEWDGAGDPR